jgi:hypothetical protein
MSIRATAVAAGGMYVLDAGEEARADAVEATELVGVACADVVACCEV